MKRFAFALLFSLSALLLSSCGVEESSSQLMFASSSSECKVLTGIDNNSKITNKGYGTITIVHPEIVSHFTFQKLISKFTQVKSVADSQEIVRQLIRSFLVTRVPGVTQEQPLRPFVIPELLCPILDATQKKNASFCNALFFNDQAAAITAALAFLDRKESFGAFSLIDKLLQPLTFIKRPPRVDLTASEQTVEARVIYGLRDATGGERKPATFILEFAGTSQPAFYEKLVQLFIQFRDQNNAAARKLWAQGIEGALDSFLFANANVAGRWEINQIRVNELAFRGDDILWDFREYNFPSASSSILEFSQVPVANTPWVEFEQKDKDPAMMDADFTRFLGGKGLTAADLDAEQSVDFFEEFLSSPMVKVKNAAKLESFVKGSLSGLKNDSGSKGFKGFAYHNDPTWAAPAALARPGMRFFDGDTAWSKNLMESCQGCHVSASSISTLQTVDTMQGFYQVSPRKLPSSASAGTEFAGSNIVSSFLLRETRLRFQSLLKLVGCLDPVTTPTPETPGDGHSSGSRKEMVVNQRELVPLSSFTCAHKTDDAKITQCTGRSTLDTFACSGGHTELVRCLDPAGTFWLVACASGPTRKIKAASLLNSCLMPLPSSKGN